MFKHVNRTIVEIDLRKIPPKEWPPEAKTFAASIISRQRREFERQLDKLDWLIFKIEKAREAELEVLAVMGLDPKNYL